MRRISVALVVVVVAALFTLGGSSRAQEDGPQATISAQATAIANLEATISALQTQVAELDATVHPRDPRCLDVPEKAQDTFRTAGADPAWEISGFQAVKSKDAENLWFVAALVKGEGMGDGVIVVFSMGDLETGAGTIGINEAAQMMYFYPSGTAFEVPVTMEYDGANVAVKCLRSKLGL
jgi:hypothetical protein